MLHLPLHRALHLQENQPPTPPERVRKDLGGDRRGAEAARVVQQVEVYKETESEQKARQNPGPLSVDPEAGQADGQGAEDVLEGLHEHQSGGQDRL